MINDNIDEPLFKSLKNDCDELIKILTATIKSSKDNNL